jgi:hypothetical protein
MAAVTIAALVTPLVHRLGIWFATPKPPNNLKACSPCWIPPTVEAAWFRQSGNIQKAEDLENAILKRDMASEFFMMGSAPQFHDMAVQLLAKANALQKRSGFFSNLPSRTPLYEPMFGEEIEDETQLEPIQP